MSALVVLVLLASTARGEQPMTQVDVTEPRPQGRVEVHAHLALAQAERSGRVTSGVLEGSTLDAETELRAVSLMLLGYVLPNVGIGVGLPVRIAQSVTVNGQDRDPEDQFGIQDLRVFLSGWMPLGAGKLGTFANIELPTGEDGHSSERVDVTAGAVGAWPVSKSMEAVFVPSVALTGENDDASTEANQFELDLGLRIEHGRVALTPSLRYTREFGLPGSQLEPSSSMGGSFHGVYALSEAVSVVGDLLFLRNLEFAPTKEISAEGTLIAGILGVRVGGNVW